MNTARLSGKRSEYEGVCTYCGFGLVTNDPRACCLAGRDVDALERELLAARRELAERDVRCIDLVMQRDVLKAQLAGVRAGWQPIETAPRDGPNVDLWMPDPGGGSRIPDCYWSGIDNRWRVLGENPSCRWAAEPTHWMPLPAPPADPNSEGGGGMSHVTCHACGGTEHYALYGCGFGPMGSYTICDCGEMLEFAPDLEGLTDEQIERTNKIVSEFREQVKQKRIAKGMEP